MRAMRKSHLALHRPAEAMLQHYQVPKCPMSAIVFIFIAKLDALWPTNTITRRLRAKKCRSYGIQLVRESIVEKTMKMSTLALIGHFGTW